MHYLFLQWYQCRIVLHSIYRLTPKIASLFHARSNSVGNLVGQFSWCLLFKCCVFYNQRRNISSILNTEHTINSLLWSNHSTHVFFSIFCSAECSGCGKRGLDYYLWFLWPLVCVRNMAADNAMTFSVNYYLSSLYVIDTIHFGKEFLVFCLQIDWEAGTKVSDQRLEFIDANWKLKYFLIVSSYDSLSIIASKHQKNWNPAFELTPGIRMPPPEPIDRNTLSWRTFCLAENIEVANFLCACKNCKTIFYGFNLST